MEKILTNPALPQIAVWFALPILLGVLWYLLDKQNKRDL
ncbi:hypothetical protein NitYY0814_C1538 [Nitratiruptor sp. YY08-14]|nr:hypothetical protein NitYY0810_C1530 [Nitratiruptor sp. YY08-10]BCD64684.1 hypothetical protein NitYY0814_C1538 [Nitratiruptor sp. YY08-14]